VLTIDQARDVIGATAYSNDGDRIGRIGQLYLDDATEQPEWITVSTGLFGTKESFVPLAEAKVEGDRVTVPYTKDQVKGAPRVDVEDGHLSESEEAELYRYYGLSESGPFTGTGPAGVQTGTDVGYQPDTTGYAAGTSGTVETGAPGLRGTGDVGDVRSEPAAGERWSEADDQRAEAEDRRTGRSRLRRYQAGEGDQPVS
jgi:sporulation protein YlmC with PRC-barrel domain